MLPKCSYLTRIPHQYLVCNSASGAITDQARWRVTVIVVSAEEIMQVATGVIMCPGQVRFLCFVIQKNCKKVVIPAVKNAKKETPEECVFC